VFGGKIISSLRNLQVGETVRELGLEGQKAKEGTPTMGGIIIIIGYSDTLFITWQNLIMYISC
jgi:phospho-N-acetylmuramoyl-pentapeptide-transferase